jgi:cation transport regulator ChaC
MWIFAYGSLIFRPSFRYLETRRAYVAGWMRRLWQGSPDHRGVPGAPGRVVTLLRAEGEVTGGLAYRIDPASADATLAELDAREQAGFVREMLPLMDTPGAPPFAHGLTYVAAPDNAHFAGPLPEDEIAAWVAARTGPSGPNRDYVVRLHDALRALGVEDAHLGEVVRHLGG